MFQVPVSPGVISYARELVARCNFGRRGEADGTPEQQVVGMIGQAVVQDLFDLPRPICLKMHDGGIDFHFLELGIDVKTMRRTGPPRPNWSNNFSRLQERSSADIVLFCSLDMEWPKLYVCGWILKGDISRKGRLIPAGTTRFRAGGSSFQMRSDVYEVQNRDLVAVDNFEDLVLKLVYHHDKLQLDLAAQVG